MEYSYDIEYRKSADHENAISGLPRNLVDHTGEEGGIFYFSFVEKLSVCAKDIKRATLKKTVLIKAWS